MYCWKDKAFCVNANECATQDCSRRFNEDEYNESCKRAKFDFPVAWGAFKNECNLYEVKE